jgi:hypothetical protein
MRSSPLLLVTAFSLACAIDTTEPRDLVLRQPRFNAQTSPSDLPNVIRYGAESGFGVIDLESDLWAFAGFPYLAAQTPQCGGSGQFDTFYFQEAGQLKGVIHQIANGDNVRITVYRFSTFGCDAQPIATGTGSVRWHDSDYFVTGKGTESYGVHIDGGVSLASGGTAVLRARNEWHVDSNGPRLIVRRVTLSAR